MVCLLLKVRKERPDAKLYTRWSVRDKRFRPDDIEPRTLAQFFGEYCEMVGVERDEGIQCKDARKTFTQTSHAELKQIPQATMAITGHTSAKLLDDNTYADLSIATVESNVVAVEDLTSYVYNHIESVPNSILDIYNNILQIQKETVDSVKAELETTRTTLGAQITGLKDELLETKTVLTVKVDRATLSWP